MRAVVASRGRLVLVGGHSRGVGKTLTVERILRARRGERWLAIKVSSHRHGHAGRAAAIDEDTIPWVDTQTGRYLLAGARRAWLLRAPDDCLAAAADLVNHHLRADGLNLVVESNRLVDWVLPDRILFAVSPWIDDWKPSSSRVVTRADAFVVCAACGPGAAIAVREAVDRSRDVFQLGGRTEDERFAEWLAAALGRSSVVARSVIECARVPHVGRV